MMQIERRLNEPTKIRLESAGDLEFSADGVRLLEDAPLIPWHDAVKALEQYAMPQRYMLGVEPSALRRWENGIIEKLNLTPYPQQKESTMIEKKNFVTPPTKTPAASLSQRHVGSLVTITLPSGSEITDILTGVMSGVPSRLRNQPHSEGQVVVFLQNVGVGYDPEYLRDRNGEFPLDPKSVVLVRRPKTVKAAKK